MWYNKIVQDISALPDFIMHYENELIECKQDCNISGSLEKLMARLPGITEQRYNQLQEIEAVLNYMNIQLRKLKRTYFQKYMENYQRVLTSRDAEKYVEGESDVVDYEVLINEVAYIRNRYLGAMKALESKNFMLGHITKLRSVGMEDATV